jgi:hypothetical protein
VRSCKLRHSFEAAAAGSGRTDTAAFIYRSLKLGNFSQKTRARGKNGRTGTFVAITVTVVAALLVAAALVQNRGVQIDARPGGVGVRLDPAQQPAPSTTTYNDGAPIVIAAGAKVEVHVTGPTRSAPAPRPARDGISTYGAASPIVTGQGAVVKSTVDTRP